MTSPMLPFLRWQLLGAGWGSGPARTAQQAAAALGDQGRALGQGEDWCTYGGELPWAWGSPSISGLEGQSRCHNMLQR
ncbi:hypothetical protein NDU88_001095 [Pleurodeles waltl]|uniref:Uncharacterized protein n=1 Tax=Pleurodeles waltl TaxID=8319 RepID=A0AAV7U5Y8_PLEWA|nr:hypothetical protein NDU88_001095 [Pleurodeles waltl]